MKYITTTPSTSVECPDDMSTACGREKRQCWSIAVESGWSVDCGVSLQSRPDLGPSTERGGGGFPWVDSNASPATWLSVIMIVAHLLSPHAPYSLHRLAAVGIFLAPAVMDAR